MCNKGANMKFDNIEEGSSSIGFRCPPEMRAGIEAIAADEGLSNSAVVKRAVLRELRRKEESHAA
jgi:Ribbon-helix-helix protein, copG family